MQKNDIKVTKSFSASFNINHPIVQDLNIIIARCYEFSTV